MAPYLVRRVIQTIPVLLGVSLVVFVILRLAPGDPAMYLVGIDTTPETLAAMRHAMGLDQPLPVQYGLWLLHVAQGDFGNSYVNGLPISRLVFQRMPATIELALAGMFFTIAIGFPLGMVAGTHRATRWDYLISGFTSVTLGVPVFLLGILMIAVFALYLGWLPAGGRTDFDAGWLPALRSLLMPALCLGLGHSVVLIRFVRNSILEALHEDYVRTARAKGLLARVVLNRHVMRNAMIPVVTILGIVFGRLLAGVVITESVFAWPGLGSMVITSIGNRDYGLVQATLLLIVVVFILVNLVIDMLYGWLDPRIRLGEG